MKKKADLTLSINAIVVLILAITMLGLGLGFMRSMFNNPTIPLLQEYCDEIGNMALTDYQYIVTGGDANGRDIIFYKIECDNAVIDRIFKLSYQCTGYDKWGDCEGQALRGSQ